MIIKKLFDYLYIYRFTVLFFCFNIQSQTTLNNFNDDHSELNNKSNSYERITSICLFFNFQDFIQHLSFIIKTNDNSYYQLDLRPRSTNQETMQWVILLQKDDWTDRLRFKYESYDNCKGILLKGITTLKDLTLIAKEFIDDCLNCQFFFLYALELNSINQWKQMYDYSHEKAMNRVNCLSFTDYIMRRISNMYERNIIEKIIIEKGNDIRIYTSSTKAKDCGVNIC